LKKEVREFWISNFGENEGSVSWQRFYEVLCQVFDEVLAKNNPEALQLIFDPEKEDKVTMLKLNLVTKDKSLSDLISSVDSITLASSRIVNVEAREFWENYLVEDDEIASWLDFYECNKIII
jgi:hypothetical protein